MIELTIEKEQINQIITDYLKRIHPGRIKFYNGEGRLVKVDRIKIDLDLSSPNDDQSKSTEKKKKRTRHHVGLTDFCIQYLRDHPGRQTFQSIWQEARKHFSTLNPTQPKVTRNQVRNALGHGRTKLGVVSQPEKNLYRYKRNRGMEE